MFWSCLSKVSRFSFSTVCAVISFLFWRINCLFSLIVVLTLLISSASSCFWSESSCCSVLRLRRSLVNCSLYVLFSFCHVRISSLSSLIVDIISTTKINLRGRSKIRDGGCYSTGPGLYQKIVNHK